MKKADVEQRYDRGTYRPTINVKWHPWMPDLIRKFERATTTGRLICAVCGAAKFFHVPTDINNHKFKAGGSYTIHEFGDDTEFWAWVHDNLDDYGMEWTDYAYEIARDGGWEAARELAAEVFPQSVDVWSDGRSGGWLVVDGLPDVEDWDAIQLGYWSKFVRGVQAILDDLDYQFIWHLNVNVWEPHNERAKKLAEVMVRS